MTRRRAEAAVVIDLPIDWDSAMLGRENWKVVKAEIVDVAPHLAHIMSFAVHRDQMNPSEWQVSNIETGLSVFRAETSGRDKSLVLQAVKNRLAQQSAKKCAKKINALAASRRGKK